MFNFRFLKKDVKAPFVGGKKSRKFPEGLHLGIFSNACGDEEWTNTGVFHRETLCCQFGKHVPCDEIIV